MPFHANHSHLTDVFIKSPKLNLRIVSSLCVVKSIHIQFTVSVIRNEIGNSDNYSFLFDKI